MANPACLIGLCAPGLLGASLMLAAAASAQSPAVTSDFDRKVLELHFKQTIFGRPLAAPPNLPKDRLARLRQAFLDTMKDPEFLADAEKMKLDVTSRPARRWNGFSLISPPIPKQSSRRPEPRSAASFQ